MKKKQFPTSKRMTLRLKRHKKFLKIMHRVSKGINDTVSGWLEEAFKQVAERVKEEFKKPNLSKIELEVEVNEMWEKWTSKWLADKIIIN